MENRDNTSNRNNNFKSNQLKFSGKAIPTRNIVEWNTIPHPENNYIDEASFLLGEEQVEILKQYQNNFKELNKCNYWSKNKNTLVSSHDGVTQIKYFQPEIVDGYYLPFKIKKTPVTQIVGSSSPVLDSHAEFTQYQSSEQVDTTEQNESTNLELDTDFYVVESSNSPVKALFTERTDFIESTYNLTTLAQNNTLGLNQASANTSQLSNQSLTSSTISQNQSISTESEIPNSILQVSTAPLSVQISAEPTVSNQSSLTAINVNVNQLLISQQQSVSQPVNAVFNALTNQSDTATINPSPKQPETGMVSNNNQNNDSKLHIFRWKPASDGYIQSQQPLSTNTIPSVPLTSPRNNLVFQQTNQAQIQNILPQSLSADTQFSQTIQQSTMNKDVVPSTGSPAQINSSAPEIVGPNVVKTNSQAPSLPLQNSTILQPIPQQPLLTTLPQNQTILPTFPKWDTYFDFDTIYDLIICYDFIRSYKNILFKDLVSQLSQSFWFFCFTFLNPDISTLQIHVIGYLLKCFYDKSPQIKPLFPLEQVSISNFNLFLWYSIQSFKIPLPKESTTHLKDLNIYSTSRKYRTSLLKSIIVSLVKSAKLDIQGLYVTSQDFKIIKRASLDTTLLSDFTWAIMIETHDSSQQDPSNNTRTPLIENSATTSPILIPATPMEENTGNNTPTSENDKMTLFGIKPILQKLMILKPLDKLLDIGLLPLIKEFQIIYLGTDRFKRTYYYFASIGGILVKEGLDKTNSWSMIDSSEMYNQVLNSLYLSNYNEGKLLTRLTQLSHLFTDQFLQKIKLSMNLLKIPYTEAIKKLIESNEIPLYAKLDVVQETSISDMLILNTSTPISFHTFKGNEIAKIQILKIENSMKQMIELLELPSESEIFSRFQSPLPDQSIERTCQEFLAKLQLYIDQSIPSYHSKPEQFQFLKNFAHLNKYFIRASILLYNHLTSNLNDENLPSNIRSTIEFNEIYINTALELVKNCMMKVFKGDEKFRVQSLLHKDKVCPALQPHKNHKCHFHYKTPGIIQFAKIKLPDTSKIPRKRRLPEKRQTTGRQSTGKQRINYQEAAISDDVDSSEYKSIKTTGSKKSNNSKKNLLKSKKQAKLYPFIQRRKIVLSSTSSELSDLNLYEKEEDHSLNSDLGSPQNFGNSKLLKDDKNEITSEDDSVERVSDKRVRSGMLSLDTSDDIEEDEISYKRIKKNRATKKKLPTSNFNDLYEDDEINSKRFRKVLSSDDDLDNAKSLTMKSPSPFEDDGSSLPL